MQRNALFFFIIFQCCGLVPLCAAEKLSVHSKKQAANNLQFFEKKIRPVLVEHCYQCHSVKSKEVEGGLLLDTRAGIRKGGDSGKAVVPKNLEESLLIDSIKHESFEMPPEKKLSKEIIADFEKWIKMGAPDPRDGKSDTAKLKKKSLEENRNYWAFRPLSTAKFPAVSNKKWARGSIDRLVLSQLEKANLSPAADADRYTLLRRATYDLTGVPPTHAEVQQFINDKSPDAFAKVIDRLLESEQFGERWGRHWLDVARYADSSGGGRDFTYTNAWRYRDYVINSFNKNKPFDQFLKEQIAGDLLPYKTDTQRSEQLIATGFLVIGPKNLGERDKEKTRMDVVDEQLDTVGRAFLGLTLGCARCHSHKFDPVSLNDYYAIAGIFSSTRTLRKPKPTDSQSKWQPVPLPVDKAEAKRLKKQYDIVKKAAGKKRTKTLAHVTELEKQLKELTKSSAPNVKEKMAQLEKQLIVARFQGDVASGENSVLGGYISPLPMALAVEDQEKAVDEKIRIRGQVHSLGNQVPRGFLSLLTNEKSPEIPKDKSGRVQFAEWMTDRHSPATPLVARVAVNRIWKHLFGAGIVRTTDNFGIQGEKPSHPELLDHLATRLIEQDWSIKEMIREIMLSRVYQLKADQNEMALKIDPDNRLLWRANGRRLDVEAIRDSILTISGLLDKQQGGSTLTLIGSLGSSRRGYRTIDINPFYRRGVYLPIIRSGLSSQMDMYSVFDFPDSGFVNGHRDSTTVPTQALYLMNSPFMVKNSQAIAKQFLEDPQLKDDEARVKRAFISFFSRPATKQETTSSLKYITNFQQAMQKQNKKTARLEAWTSFCQSLFASNEFLFLN